MEILHHGCDRSGHTILKNVDRIVIFLRMFKQVISIGERIAVALEDKEGNRKSDIDGHYKI